MGNGFANQTAVVTGASSGLGLAVARAFLQQGAFVYLLARDRERLEAAAADLRAISPTVATLVADVTRQADVDAAFAQVREQRSDIHILVNAAGLSDRAAILQTTPDDFQRLWELNFLGAVRCTLAAADNLIATRGHLINIGSLASKVASPYLGAYPAAKFALAAYSQQLRLELGPRGLHVLLVCPGPLLRRDAGQRYDVQARGLPPAARRPGGGARLNLIDPAELSRRILRACERRDPELVVPSKVRFLAAISQLVPRWGDRIILRQTTGVDTD